MVGQGAIPFLEYFRYFFRRELPQTALSFEDSDGKLLNTKIINVSRQVKSPLFGTSTYDEAMLVLKEWFHSQKMYHKDHLLVTVMDWEMGVFRLEREPASAVNQALLAERNKQFTNILYDLLENSHDENVMEHVAIPTVYALLPEKGGYPPDHWKILIKEDNRMFSNGYDIRYRDSDFSMFEMMLGQDSRKSKVTPAKKTDKAQQDQVYRFRAEFKHHPEIWREIEIQGKQTLGNLDGILRDIFNHDSFDHLSGFWQLVERKGSKRKSYREVDLGDINPFEGGEAANIRISELDLQVNDRLKYVYDFGDWIEHILVVKAIGEPEPKVKYPREAARNKPKYQDCVSCKEKGKKTVATWICIDCSNETGQDVLLCEDCLDAHEDHFVDELTY